MIFFHEKLIFLAYFLFGCGYLAHSAVSSAYGQNYPKHLWKRDFQMAAQKYAL